MTSRIRKTLAFFIALVTFLLLGTATLVWWLSSRPVTTSFFTPYIERGIESYLPGTKVLIESTQTEWSNIEHIVSLHARNITVRDADGDTIASIPDIEVKVSALSLIYRRIVPLSLLVQAPHIKIYRDANGTMRFGDMETGAPAQSEEPLPTSDDVKGSLRPMLYDLVHTGHAGNLAIKDMEVDVRDTKSQSGWAVHVPEIAIDRTGGEVKGHALLNVTQKDQTATLQIQYRYDARKDIHLLETSVSNITPAFFAGGHPNSLGLGPLAIFDLPLTGNLGLAFDFDLQVASLSADLHGEAGKLNYSDFWDEPRAIKSLDLIAFYDVAQPDANNAKLALDFGGPTLNIAATLKPSIQPGHDGDFELSAQMDNWPMDDFGKLWPKPVIPSPRAWIASSLSKGTFDHAEGVFKGSLKWSDMGNMVISDGGGKISASNARVDYLSGMPPVEGVNAKATFDLNQMSVDISGGGIGALRLQPFTLLATDFQKTVQYADIPVKVAGPILDILKLIDVPRLGYAKAIGLTPEDISGSAIAIVRFRLPLLNDVEMKDVEISAHAELTGVASSKLVKNIDITNGMLTLNLNKEGFGIDGSAGLNKIPSQIVWKEPFETKKGEPLQQGTIKAVLGDEQWKQPDFEMFKGSRGPVPVVIEVKKIAKNVTQLSGQFDLTGAEIHLDQLKWKKAAGQAASLAVTADIPEQKDITVKSISLSGPQANVKGSALLSHEGGLLKLNLDPFAVGRTDASLKYEQVRDEDKTLRMTFEGKALDISGLKGGHDVATQDPRPKEYNIRASKLYTSDTGVIADAQGFAIRDPQGWKAIDLKGLADGDTPISMLLVPKNGKATFEASTDNFGKAMKGLGFIDTISGGKMRVTGWSTPENLRIIEGFIKISGFTVRDFPALAVLLNATSPFGFADLISGTMSFDRLKGKFRWQGDTLEFKEVHMPGPAVGIDMEGKLDMNEGNANLSGLVAPFSMVNSILGSIPLVGELLTGGNGGGVFAVAYTITGNLANPNVSVNPASLLTPGFLRNLFFSSDEEEGDNAKPASAPSLGSEPAQPTQAVPNNLNIK